MILGFKDEGDEDGEEEDEEAVEQVEVIPPGQEGDRHDQGDDEGGRVDAEDREEDPPGAVDDLALAERVSLEQMRAKAAAQAARLTTSELVEALVTTATDAHENDYHGSSWRSFTGILLDAIRAELNTRLPPKAP